MVPVFLDELYSLNLLATSVAPKDFLTVLLFSIFQIACRSLCQGSFDRS
jgi:hypothetical protein